MDYYIKGLVFAMKSVTLMGVLWLVAIGILKLKKKDPLLKKHQYFYREFLFTTYLLIIFRVTGIVGNEYLRPGEIVSFNYIPFINEMPLLMVLNTLLFLPVGFLLPFAFKKMRKWTRTAIVGIIIIIFIELIQLFFVGRLFDIDDVIFNFLGIVLGYMTFCIGNRLVDKLKYSSSKTYGKGSFSLLLACIALIMGLPINHITVSDILFYHFGINVFGGAYEYRVTVIIPLLLCFVGLFLGIKWRNDRYARAGIIISVITAVVCLLSINFQ